jgi:hypothetical protein
MNIAGKTISKPWLIGGGLGLGLVGVLAWRHRLSSEAAASSPSSPGSGSSPGGIDPLTGLPASQDDAVDPLTGSTYLAEMISPWTRSRFIVREIWPLVLFFNCRRRSLFWKPLMLNSPLPSVSNNSSSCGSKKLKPR